MTIPFLHYFKKRTAPREADSTPAEQSRPTSATSAKPSSQRLSKTVMPNTTRSTSTDIFRAAGDSAPNVRAAGVRALPPSVALALQPKVERAISLPLSDVLERVPVGFLKPTESFDATQMILLKASEIEQGMADDKPAVSLFSIYEQVPDIFVRNVRPDDANQVAVPRAKVLEQLRKMQVRDDQDLEIPVPQVETPILKVTIEDTARFGTKLQTPTISAEQSVRVEPATAKALSSAEPEPAAKEKSGATPVSGTTTLTAPARLTPRPSAPDPVAPARIPFKLPPKGTDEAVSERVPASSASSVPLSVPTVPPSTRIPFRMTPPSDDLKPKLQIVPGTSAGDAKKVYEPGGMAPVGAKISLGLRAVAQNMPSFQLHRPADTIASDIRFELPLSLVESQLATGRVAVPVKTFRDALPEDCKSIVVIDAGEAPVLLPLQEVLTNLSPDLLKMRDDQVVEQIAESFETPFSIKAAEDARKFSEDVAGVKQDAVEAKKEEPPQAKVEQAPVEKKSAEPSLKPLQPEQPVLKLAKAEPEKPQPTRLPLPGGATVEAIAEVKAPAGPTVPGKPAAELKTGLAPVVPAPSSTAPKSEPQVATPTPAPLKNTLEQKSAAAAPIPDAKGVAPVPVSKPEVAAPKPTLKLPPLEKVQTPNFSPVPPQVAASGKTEAPATPSVSATPQLKLPAAPKLDVKENALKEAGQDVVASPAPKIAPKVTTPAPALKLMPTAPAAAVSEPSQPQMQTMPVPSQVVPEAAATELKAPAPAPVKPVAPVSVKPVTPAAAPSPLAPAKAEVAQAPNKPAEKTPEVNTNAKAVVEEASRLDGISAVTVVFDDGLALAGNLPDELQAGGLCAIAPSILHKINRHTVGTKFGQLVAMTLDWHNAQVSFFAAGAVCLGVVHAYPVLPGDTHRRLTELTKELSRTYAQPGN